MADISIFFAIGDSYSQHCCVAITSILYNNRDSYFNFYILTDYISDKNKNRINQLSKKYTNFRITYVDIDSGLYSGLKLNIGHISEHTYYRYAIADMFPNLDKGLYLDCDLVVNGDISGLWNTCIDNYYCAGVEDLWIKNCNYIPKIGLKRPTLYVNAGVLLLNLKKLREDCMFQVLIDNTKRLASEIEYQDQDVINISLNGKIKEVSCVYNFATDNVEHMKDIKDDAVIIHYTGSVKPWSIKKKCNNKLKRKYFEYLLKSPFKTQFFAIKVKHFVLKNKNKFISKYQKRNTPKRLKVALIIDEFFGGAGTAYGGYGFLARNYIAKYIPNDDIKIDVLLQERKVKASIWNSRAIKHHVDHVNLYELPPKKYARRWLRKQNYDLYLSIEMTTPILKYVKNKNKRLVLWIQDPRPWSEWQEINTVKLFPESCYWNSEIYDLVNRMNHEGRVRFVSQGNFLNDKAKELYRLNDDVQIDYLPNPVDIDYSFDVTSYKKKNSVIFIGRIESVKRGWLFCEIAKALPEYEFYMLGQTFREKSENESIMSRYKEGIPNLHFTGHVEGPKKAEYIRDAKILVNTSIHEALPVTFLEALAYGTLLVSCRNPDGLTERFGKYVGQVLGDGFDQVSLFVDAIKELVEDEETRMRLSQEAIKYVEEVHNVEKFKTDLRRIISEEIHKSKD